MRRLRGFFMLGAAVFTSATTPMPMGTNINGFRHNNVMAEPALKQFPAQLSVEQQAAAAVSALKDFIYTGSQQKKGEFVAAYRDLTRANAPLDAANALAAEFRVRIAGDPQLGPIMEAYRNANGGKFYAPEFIAFMESVRDAALSGNQEKLAMLRDTTFNSQEFVNKVVEPLLKSCAAEASAPKLDMMKEAATEAAGMFIGLLDSARWEEGRRPSVGEMIEKRNLMKQAAASMLEQMAAHRSVSGAFEPGFADSFRKVLVEECPQCINLLDAYALDNGRGKLDYKDYAALCEQLPKLFNALLTPGYNIDALSSTYGRGLAAAARSFIIQMSVPVLAGITVESLSTRVRGVEQFVAANGLTGLDGVIGGWKQKLNASPDREALLALNAEMPSMDMLEDVMVMMARSNRSIKAVVQGDVDFYRTIGPRVWLPRLQTTVTSVRDGLNDQVTGKFAAAMLAKENIDLQKVENLITAANNANQNVRLAISTLDELLRTTPQQQPRLDAIGQVFGKDGIVNKSIDMLSDRIAAFYAKPDREALRAAVAERLMIQFAVPVVGKDLVSVLRARYDDMAKDQKFLSFRSNFTAEIDRHIASLATSPQDLSGDRLLSDSRRERAMKAREYFASMPMEYAYGLYLALQDSYGTHAVLSSEAQAFYDQNFGLEGELRQLTATDAARQKLYQLVTSTSAAGKQTLANAGITVDANNNVTLGPDSRAWLQTYVQQNAGARNWNRAVAGNVTEMSKVCALAAGFAELPAPYAGNAMLSIGRKLIRNYDDASIALVASTISGSSQMFIQGDYQHLLFAYYRSLPGKLDRLFPDITAMQQERREQAYDVRIRTPPEDRDFLDIFIPALILRIRVPKRVYEEWRSMGLAQVAAAPSIVNSASWPPDLVRVMSEFIDEPMLDGKITLPTPFIRLPILLQNIKTLMPDVFPPLGEYIAAAVSADATYSRQYTVTKAEGKTSDASTTTINAAQDFVREGAVTTGRETYSVSERIGAKTYRKGTLEFQNVRVAKNYNINTATFDFEKTGTRLQTIGSAFSAIAPRGAETAMLFRRDEADDGTVNFAANVFQRGPNGSFMLVDAATLTAEEATSLYEQAFKKPLERLYGSARLQPKGGGLAQLDGAVLFSGPFTSEYTSWEDFQGLGIAGQGIEYGGYFDYQKTNLGKAAGAVGRFMPDKQALWLGRLTGENLRTEADGTQKLYGEIAYLKADETEFKGFVGAAKNLKADDFQGAVLLNHVFNRDVLGMRYGGIGFGWLTKESAGGTETLGGGRIYGVSSDMLNGLVVSALYRTLTTQTASQVVLSTAAQAFYDQNFGLDGELRQLAATDAARQKLYQLVTSTSAADKQTLANAGITVDANNNVTLGPDSRTWLQTYVQQNAGAQAISSDVMQNVISAGVRKMLTRELLLETGAGWDVLNQEGTGVLNFDWMPASYGVSDLGLRAYVISRDKKVTPILGGFGEITPLIGIRTSTEAYYPGIGELRLRTPWVDFAVGVGRLSGIAEGAHAGFRIPLGQRWTLNAATSFSADSYLAEARRLQQQEGITGVIFTMPYSSRPGFRLANVFGSVAFIHQNEQLLAKENAEARELDITGGLNWLTARSTLTVKLGTQYWEAAHLNAFSTRADVVAGLTYTVKTWKPGRMLLFINPALVADLAIGRVSDEDVTAGSNTTTTDVRVNIRGTSEF